ncbi:FAD-dependent oxidoreductase [Providencia alcalifaciens]|uniref:FAD-dependent oxidoreductase n=1 Tax=Providencia alcalifaciens TaxID=126385 RepID=UPI000D850E33|nr:FAD-dependent oxidoreductase [Providencia alcalifaciens]SPY71641.1 glutamate synthase subunit beta [Providencia alcalifaciens]
MSVNYDVIIIGSGPAGMAAAQTLRRRGIHNIAILEREAHAGGRSSSLPASDIWLARV